MNNLTEDLTAMIASMMDQNKKKTESSPDNMDSPKSQYTTNVIPYNKKYPPLKVRHSTKNYQGITQRRQCSGPQELLQPHQYVSQCSDYTQRITSS